MQEYLKENLSTWVILKESYRKIIDYRLFKIIDFFFFSPEIKPVQKLKISPYVWILYLPSSQDKIWTGQKFG